MSTSTLGPRAVLDHILDSISPASGAQAAGARQRLAKRIGAQSLGALEQLAERLAGARHAPRPRVADKLVVVCAADHGVADPGVDLGDNNPTAIAVRYIAEGGAAINTVARTAGAKVVVVDCGVRGMAGDARTDVLTFRLGNGTADITRGAAMTPVDALTAIQTGIALAFSLADRGLDVLALGQLAVGGQPASAAVVCALADLELADVPEADRAAVESALRENSPNTVTPLEVLSSLGGFEVGMLTGLLLGAASIHVPIVLDDHGTSAAALIAAGLSPHVRGYLIAAHAGSSPVHRHALSALGLAPLFDLGLAHGEGAGAALALPMIDTAAALLDE